MKLRSWRVMCVLLVWTGGVCAAAPARSVAQRRADLEQRAAGGSKAIPSLVKALDDESPLVRRAAARLLLEIGAPAESALVGALDNSDMLVRRVAVHALGRRLKVKTLPHLAKALKDKHVLVRRIAVEYLIAMRPRTADVTRLLKLAGKDKDFGIRLLVLKALWPFHKETKSVRDDPTRDKDIQVTSMIPLPKQGWRFHLDPDRDGHKKRWFDPQFDDTKWKLIDIEQAWQKAGYDYIGVAWYRRWIDLPAKPKHTAVEMHFQGVDECAWVWVNGQYVGQHDIGPIGWDQPFRLDVTKELKWGVKNHITVRAMNTACAGGIWRPVLIDVLE